MPRFDPLDSIDWASLHPAYGEASDIPAHLRNLTNPDQAVRLKALGALGNLIAHPCGVYPASLAAIPFLLELVADPDQSERGDILEIVRFIAQGQSWHDSHQTLLQLAGIDNAEVAEKREQELTVVTQIKQTFQGYLAFFVSLLNESDELVFQEALAILKRLTPTETAIQQVIKTCSTHNQLVVRADCLVLLSRWNCAEALSIAQQLFAKATDDLLKLTSAMVIVSETLPAPIPLSINNYLVDVIEQHDPQLIMQYESLVLIGGFWLDLACWLLEVESAIREACAAYFVQAIEQHPYEHHLKAALLVVFGTRKVDHAHILTPLQRQVVAIIADTAYCKVGMDVPLLNLLDSFGLPSTIPALDAYLGYPNAQHPGLEVVSKQADAEYRLVADRHH